MLTTLNKDLATFLAERKAREIDRRATDPSFDRMMAKRERKKAAWQRRHPALRELAFGPIEAVLLLVVHFALYLIAELLITFNESLFADVYAVLFSIDGMLLVIALLSAVGLSEFKSVYEYTETEITKGKLNDPFDAVLVKDVVIAMCKRCVLYLLVIFAPMAVIAWAS